MQRMTPDAFIQDAIAVGERLGIAALGPHQRLVFLISEAECLTDMEGIDAFLAKYSPDWLLETAAAFAAVGAVDIAAEIQALPNCVPVGDPRLDRLNRLVAERVGYDYTS